MVKKPKVSEAQIQKSIISYLNVRRILHNRINNGQFVLDGSGTDKYGRHRKVSKNRAVRCNSINGIPDIETFFTVKNEDKNILQIVIYLEVKSPTGRQSKDQKLFQSRIEEAGGFYFVVRSIEDVQSAFNQVDTNIKMFFGDKFSIEPLKSYSLAERAK